MKKTISAALATILTITGLSVSTLGLASAPSIDSTEYKGSGRVEVEFTRDVDYKNAKVKVKDSDGKSYTAKITSKDDDELNFKVSNIAAGKSYTYTISGVRREGTSSYGSVSGKFKVKGSSSSNSSTTANVKIEEVDYDSKGYVEVEFTKKVKYNNVKVTVKDEDGKSYTAKVRKKGSEELKFRVPSIVEGRRKKYTFTISGVGLKSGDGYTSVSGSFYAYDD